MPGVRALPLSPDASAVLADRITPPVGSAMGKPGFVWGVATASYQIEGAVREDGRTYPGDDHPAMRTLASSRARPAAGKAARLASSVLPTRASKAARAAASCWPGLRTVTEAGSSTRAGPGIRWPARSCGAP